MRIEQLFGPTTEPSNIEQEVFIIKESNMVQQSHGGWICTIDQLSLNLISLSNHIVFQLFDKWGNEVGSGSDFIISKDAEKITVKSLSTISSCNEYKLIMIALK